MKKTVCIWGEAARFANYRRAVESAGGRAVFHRGAPFEVQKWDALILPGGGDLEPWRYGRENTASRGLEPRRDQEELELLAEFTAAGKPVLGICRGMQVINVFFGGSLLQDIPGHSALDSGDRLHTLRETPSALPPLLEKVVNSAHHQAADRLGSGLRAAQWAPDGVVEGICHERLPVWGVQWHPERLVFSEEGRRLFGAFLAV